MVIPVYRTEKRFEACLSAVLRQMLTDFEVIVVDDASPCGGVGEIVRAAGDGRVTMIRHIQNVGAMQARWTGVRAALGQYVSFVDSDDEVDGTSFCVNRGGDRHDLQADQVRRAMLAGKLTNNLCNKLVTTELLRSVHEGESDFSRRVYYGEDLLALFDLIRRVDRFAHVPDPNYRYLRRSTSVTVRADALEANVRSLSVVLDRIPPTLAQ